MPVLLAALGVFAVSLDSSINMALPSIASAFHLGPAAVRWVIICYVLTYALMAFAAGLVADRVGPGPVFTTGLALSCAAFVGYAAAASYGAVLALRVTQGVGAGLVYGTAPALVTLALPRERHGRGLGLMSLGLGLGLGLGPLVGGAVVERFGWPGAFLYRAPIMGGLTVLALVVASRAEPTGPIARMVAARDLLRPPVLTGAALAFLSNYAQFSVWLLVPFFLVSILSLGPALGGVFFMLTPLGTAVAAPFSGWVTDRVGARWPLAAGLIVEAVGLVTIARFTAEPPLALVAVALGLVGLGVGVFQVPNLAQMMAAFPAGQQGAAGGLVFLSRTLGSAVGVQVTAMVFDARVTSQGFIGAFGSAFTAAAAACALAIILTLIPVGSRR
ncbi:MAG TPA: MFS transporter [Methylomirabilota bacterium]|nr:MFS transporter [Methylomirabilota bacterium]